MARFRGVIGFGETVETVPGVWKDVIVEHTFGGDVLLVSRQLDNTDKVNPDISVSNSISIVANAYANENFMEIRYIQWKGKLWTISKVDVQPPRLILRVGEIYNGQKAPAPSNP
jgi:hypothetical protein